MACRCINDEELNPVLEIHDEQEIRYSGACSDITTVLPQDRVAVHSGIVSSYIKQNTDKFKTIISIWELTEGCIVKRKIFVPSKVHSRKVNGWDVRMSDEVIRKMMDCRSVKLPLETGGVLIGDFDLHNRIVYIVDIEYTPRNLSRLIPFAKDADYLFCEAAFLERDRDIAKKKHHLTAHQAGLIAKEAGARKIIPFHFSPRYQHNSDLLYNEAEEAFKAI